jgi:hypothetical protein
VAQFREPPELGCDTHGVLSPSFPCRSCGEQIVRARRLEGGVMYAYANPDPEGDFWLDGPMGWLTKYPAGESTRD